MGRFGLQSRQPSYGFRLSLEQGRAFKRFNQIIQNEKNPEMSWVADAFDENGEVLDGYELDEHIESNGTQEYACWWNITDKNDWYQHDFLEIRIMEVK